MGTMRGEYRGKTQLEVYKKYAKARRHAKEEGLMNDLSPDTKQECYDAMTKDESTGEWVLNFAWCT